MSARSAKMEWLVISFQGADAGADAVETGIETGALTEAVTESRFFLVEDAGSSF